MRPLPTTTQSSPLVTTAKPAANGAVPISQTLDLGPIHPASPVLQNRRAACGVQRAYPWLLVASTAAAAIFCGLYLTKPVVVAGSDSDRNGDGSRGPAPVTAAMFAGPKDRKDPALMPPGHLPGDRSKPQAADPRSLATASGTGENAAFEETNLRIQHVLQAQGPAGEDLGKIMLEVPVLYRSRSLRWSPEEVAQAKNLMRRIGNYQEASQIVRDEGRKLLGEWNTLVAGSIPADVLRADSPSLNEPSRAASGEPQDTVRAVEIHNP